MHPTDTVFRAGGLATGIAGRLGWRINADIRRLPNSVLVEYDNKVRDSWVVDCDQDGYPLVEPILP